MKKRTKRESDLYLRPTPPEVIKEGLRLRKKMTLTAEDYFRGFTI
jgi:hypothetical protein